MGRTDTATTNVASEKATAQENAAQAGQKLQEAAGHAWEATKDVAAVAGAKIREGAAVVKDAIVGKAEDVQDAAADLNAETTLQARRAEATAIDAKEDVKADARELHRDLATERPAAVADPAPSENVIVEAWHATKTAAGEVADYISEGASAIKESIVGHSDDAADVAHDAKLKAKEVGREAQDVASDTKEKAKSVASDTKFKAERDMGFKPRDPDSFTEKVQVAAQDAWIATKETARDIKETVTGKTETERVADDVKGVAYDAKEKTKEVAHDAKEVVKDTAHDARRNLRREGF